MKVIELQMSLVENWKSFTPFLNTLTADDKYSLISKDKWMQTIQMHFSQKQNIFYEFFSAFLESELNFEHFQKEMALRLTYFRNYPPRKACLNKCLNAPVWEDLSTGEMINETKHWFNLNQSASIIFTDHCESNWVANATLWDMKILHTFS